MIKLQGRFFTGFVIENVLYKFGDDRFRQGMSKIWLHSEFQHGWTR